MKLLGHQLKKDDWIVVGALAAAATAAFAFEQFSSGSSRRRADNADQGLGGGATDDELQTIIGLLQGIAGQTQPGGPTTTPTPPSSPPPDDRFGPPDDRPSPHEPPDITPLPKITPVDRTTPTPPPVSVPDRPNVIDLTSQITPNETTAFSGMDLGGGRSYTLEVFGSPNLGPGAGGETYIASDASGTAYFRGADGSIVKRPIASVVAPSGATVYTYPAPAPVSYAMPETGTAATRA